MLNNKKFSLDDLNFEIMLEDDEFLSVNAGATDDDGAGTYSTETTSWTCAMSGSLIHSLSSLVSLSDPSNTYSEIDCC